MFVVFQLLQILLGVWMWTLLGRAVLWLLIRAQAHTNPVYRVMTLVCWPLLRALRALLPARVPEAHLGFYALLGVVALRIGIYLLFYQQGWIPGAVPTIP
jgi:hypothetical protein